MFERGADALINNKFSHLIDTWIRSYYFFIWLLVRCIWNNKKNKKYIRLRKLYTCVGLSRNRKENPLYLLAIRRFFQRISLIGIAYNVSKERQYKGYFLISNESDFLKCALNYFIFLVTAVRSE